VRSSGSWVALTPEAKHGLEALEERSAAHRWRLWHCRRPRDRHDADESSRGLIFRVDVERLSGEVGGGHVVAACRGHPGQPDHRDRVARIRVGHLAVDPLGALEVAGREVTVGDQEQLDHDA
jgi:hypothetical protein